MVLTGWAGQVSLGQFAFVAVGAVVAGALTARVGLSFWLAVPLAAAFTAAFAVAVGLPALRIRGLFLAVTTFAFAVAVRSLLFEPRYFAWLLPGAVERPTLFFFDFGDERSHVLPVRGGAGGVDRGRRQRPQEPLRPGADRPAGERSRTSPPSASPPSA